MRGSLVTHPHGCIWNYLESNFDSRYLCYGMARKKTKQGHLATVVKQFRLALDYSQEDLSRDWRCSSAKVWRAENGTEPTFTVKEIKAITAWLYEKFGKSWDDLPDSLASDVPIPFLQEAIEAQKHKSES